MKKRQLKKQIYPLILILLVLLIGSFFFPKEHKMKDLSSFTLEEIKNYVKKENLILEVKEEYHETIKEGTIISQSILPGQKLNKNESLTIIISKGKINTEQLKRLNVNELGRVPIMMYHGIHNLKNEDTAYTGGNVDKNGYQRTIEAFRNDLEKYYQEGYRMISLNDYVDGIIDVPLGYSPIILTFDDGLKNNIRVTGIDNKGDIIIDPNSAVGVLEEYKKKYPDFGVTATFFLNGGLFEQPEYNEKILMWLMNHGYEIGNHTYGHSDLTKTSFEETTKEIGMMYHVLKQYLNDNYVPIVALPFGTPYRKSHENFKAILSGNYETINYNTKATLQVGWDSNVSPFSKNFDPQFLKRIRAYDNDGLDFDIENCFERLKNERYISDGDKNKITIPKNDQIYLRDTDLSNINIYE